LWTTTCPISGSRLSPTHCQPFYLSSICLLKFPQRSASCTSPLLQCSYSTLPTLLHVPFQFLVYCSVFSLRRRGKVGLSRELCWFIPGVAVGLVCDACCSPVGLRNISQAGLELASGGMGALLFSQCNVAWISFVWVGGSRC
jgi:hypothetical protein